MQVCFTKNESKINVNVKTKINKNPNKIEIKTAVGKNDDSELISKYKQV